MQYAKVERGSRRDMHKQLGRCGLGETDIWDKYSSVFCESISTDYNIKNYFPIYYRKDVCTRYKTWDEFLHYEKWKDEFPLKKIWKITTRYEKNRPMAKKPRLPAVHRQLMSVISQETLTKAKRMGIFRSDFDIKKVLEL